MKFSQTEVKIVDAIVFLRKKLYASDNPMPTTIQGKRLMFMDAPVNNPNDPITSNTLPAAVTYQPWNMYVMDSLTEIIDLEGLAASIAALGTPSTGDMISFVHLNGLDMKMEFNAGADEITTSESNVHMIYTYNGAAFELYTVGYIPIGICSEGFIKRAQGQTFTCTMNKEYTQSFANSSGATIESVDDGAKTYAESLENVPYGVSVALYDHTSTNAYTTIAGNNYLTSEYTNATVISDPDMRSLIVYNDAAVTVENSFVSNEGNTIKLNMSSNCKLDSPDISIIQ